MNLADSYFKEIIKLYEETPHPLLYIEAYLKLAKILTVMWKVPGAEIAIKMIVMDNFDDEIARFDKTDNDSVLKRKVNRADVTAWVMCAWNPTVNYLSLDDKVKYSHFKLIFYLKIVYLD